MTVLAPGRDRTSGCASTTGVTVDRVELDPDRVELNPDVAFPPFPVWISVPATWSRLDSNPATWRRSADGLIDTTFRASRMPARERRAVVALLEGLVADCQRAGAALSLITIGRRQHGGAASFGLHLAFASDGRPASLGRVHDMLPRSGVCSEIATASGPGVVHRDRITMVVPGSAEIVPLTSVQVFVPIPGTSWTVVLSTASAYPELTEDVQTLICRAAESISTEPGGEPAQENDPRDSPASIPADDGDAGLPGDWAAAPGGGPGIERGFSTMVLRKLTPAASSSHAAALPGAPGPGAGSAGRAAVGTALAQPQGLRSGTADR